MAYNPPINVGRYTIECVGERSCWITPHCGDCGYVQSAIMYDDGSVAYDRPEIVPAYLKTAVAKALRDHINKERSFR